MEKNRYIQPALYCVAVQTAYMIAGGDSINGVSGADGLGVSHEGTSAGHITTGNVKDGGDYDVWDDDWSR